ncbi:hypothetical protein [Flavobacterium sp. IB48]|uniref:hypothetical protein n=1 Tax=Flavobacterium sp. IB48 TaxID=2779375 RepID=UPI0018E7CA96|nr:hypothetical protein [Flavobacterium sp. IB48]MBJ2124398.1 hypothetical protein [Flavobacterium sp. IB48]
MRRKINNATRSMVILLVSFTFTKCQKDDNDVGQTDARILSSAKEWFKAYESNGDNFELLQNLDYKWNDAEIRNSKDGTKTIIVPVNEAKKDATELWEQKLYIYKLSENNYEALLFEIFPNGTSRSPEDLSIDSATFSGYIAAWDLKKGFVKTASFENGRLIENGTVKLVLKNANTTGKAPSGVACPAGIECDVDGGGTTDTGIQLKEVVVYNNYQNPSSGGYIIYNGTGSGYSNYTDTGSYTNHGTGTGSGSEGGEDQSSNATDPCAKIKAQMAIANITAKIEELRKKTNLKVETGYMQSKNGPFTALTGASSTDGADKINFKPDANTVGYLHNHLDPYDKVKANGDIDPVEPIKIFSPNDVKMFVILILNANRYGIPISDTYGTMVSSSATYQLRFTGNINIVSAKANSIIWDESLDKAYKEIMKKNGLEQGFLKFLNQKIGISGIELYKIDASGNSKKTLDNSGKVTTTNCN